MLPPATSWAASSAACSARLAAVSAALKAPTWMPQPRSAATLSAALASPLAIMTPRTVVPDPVSAAMAPAPSAAASAADGAAAAGAGRAGVCCTIKVDDEGRARKPSSSRPIMVWLRSAGESAPKTTPISRRPLRLAEATRLKPEAWM